MTDPVADPLRLIGLNGTPDTAAEVERLEQLLTVPLPADYRRFLLEIGGGYTKDTLADCTVPSPFGECNLTQIHTVRQVENRLDSERIPPNMIGIGSGHFGMTTCLSVVGEDVGCVFALDIQKRADWDQQTLQRLPNLAPSIKEFFRLRDAGQLDWHDIEGYEHCYPIADSFTTFVGKLRPA